MDKHIKIVGAALVAGGLLMFIRMAPVIAIVPDDMAFPPANTEELVRLAGLAGWRWQLSHSMALVAVCFFVTAYGWHVKYLLQQGRKRIAFAVALAASLAFGLLSIALVIDGFVVPTTISNYVSLEDVAGSHELALRFFTPAMFFLFVSIGVLSSPMLHRTFHARWLGVIGQIIAVVAVTAYLTGVAGPNWSNMQIGGSLMLAAFIWHILLGARAMRGLRGSGRWS